MTNNIKVVVRAAVYTLAVIVCITALALVAAGFDHMRRFWF